MSKKIQESENYDDDDCDGYDESDDDDEESENESEGSKEKEESESEDDIDKKIFFWPCGSTILKKRHLLLKHYYTSKHQKHIRENKDEQ